MICAVTRPPRERVERRTGEAKHGVPDIGDVVRPVCDPALFGILRAQDERRQFGGVDPVRAVQDCERREGPPAVADLIKTRVLRQLVVCEMRNVCRPWFKEGKVSSVGGSHLRAFLVARSGRRLVVVARRATSRACPSRQCRGGPGWRGCLVPSRLEGGRQSRLRLRFTTESVCARKHERERRN